MVELTVIELGGRSQQHEVVEVMERVCDQKHYGAGYSYPQADMSKACSIFRGDYQEQLETVLINRDLDEGSNLLVNEICGDDITAACKGIENGLTR